MYQNVWKYVKMSENVCNCLITPPPHAPHNPRVSRSVPIYLQNYPKKTWFLAPPVNCMIVFPKVCKCLKMYQNVWKYLKMYENVSKCFKTSENVSKCLKMYQNVWKCIKMSEHVSKYLQMAANVLMRTPCTYPQCMKMYESFNDCKQVFPVSFSCRTKYI